MFGSVVMVVFQSIFHAEMHQNNVFFIFLKLFLRSVYQNDPKKNKKNLTKKINFFKNTI
jgi:mannose/fructose/N-acetylgalactosamine-specific phosphotransferase system component IID